MDKKSAVALVAIAVVAVVFLGTTENTSEDGAPFKFSLPFSFSGASLPTLNDAFNTTSAWAIFQDYLKAAKENDLDKLKSLSYQISETCANPATREECNQIMTSVYLIAGGFKFEDFKNVFHDDKQIIMATDYMKLEEGVDPTKVVLYFVKSENGDPKVLGIRFCYGEENGIDRCVITDPETRDADKDGWWDDVEALFK
jgi:hypothetical protein